MLLLRISLRKKSTKTLNDLLVGQFSSPNTHPQGATVEITSGSNMARQAKTIQNNALQAGHPPADLRSLERKLILNLVPPWLSAITSVAALVIAILAYRRSAPKIWPTVWLSVDSRGSLAARVSIHVKNNTENTMVITSAKVQSGDAKLARLQREGKPNSELTDDSFTPSIPLDITVLPDSVKTSPFAVKVDAGRAAQKDVRIRLSIAAMRPANRNMTMLIPIDIPDANTATTFKN